MMSRMERFLAWLPGSSPAHDEPISIGEEKMAKAKKDKKTAEETIDEVVEETAIAATLPEGDFQDGAQIFMRGTAGQSGSPDVIVRAAPGVIDTGGAGSLSESVRSRRPPKIFTPEGRPIDAVQTAEIGDINALGVAVQNFMPGTSEGQFFKQVLLKVLHHMHES